MIETVPQYMQRILGYAEGQQPLKIQAASAKKLERLLKGMPAAKLRKRPMPDKWSVAEIMAHLADSEIVTSFRLRQILGTPGTAIPAYDQDAWARACRYEKRDAAQVARNIPHATRSEPGAAEIARARAMETPRHALRARCRNN